MDYRYVPEFPILSNKPDLPKEGYVRLYWRDGKLCVLQSDGSEEAIFEMKKGKYGPSVPSPTEEIEKKRKERKRRRRNN